MKKILLIGMNGFIGSHLKMTLDLHFIVDCISHKNIDGVKYNDYDVIINCSLHPDLRSSSYDEKKDIDLKASRKFKGHFIMFSSRKVYGSFDDLITFTEESQLNPDDHYSTNKVITESKIIAERNNFTILRASNVFGFEYQRKSFMGYLMNKLKDSGNIEINISPYSKKDFISVFDISAITPTIVEDQIKGVYNFSSGIGELTGNVAKYLIKGYGSGDLISTSKELKDQFILDNSKLLKTLEIEDYDFDIENWFIRMGKRLCKI